MRSRLGQEREPGARVRTRGAGLAASSDPLRRARAPGRSLLRSTLPGRGHGERCARATGEPSGLRSLRSPVRGPPRARLRSRKRPTRLGAARWRESSRAIPRRCAGWNEHCNGRRPFGRCSALGARRDWQRDHLALAHRPAEDVEFGDLGARPLPLETPVVAVERRTLLLRVMTRSSRRCLSARASPGSCPSPESRTRPPRR
jgi:hypothetical protein